MEFAESHWRYESRHSQIITITHWLRDAKQDQLNLFLLQLLDELTYNSLGEMIASLVLNNKTILSNKGIENLLAFIPNDDIKEDSDNNNQFSDDSDAQASQSQSQETTNDLLVLSNDILDCLGCYLSTKDIFSLGSCSYSMHRITQRRSFLVESGDRLIELTSKKIQRIHDQKVDLWQYAVSCQTLDICDSHTSESLQLLKQIQTMPTYTNWFEISVQNAQKITLSGCASMLTAVPIEEIFGVEYPDTNTVHRNALKIHFRGGSCECFFRDYNNFFITKCDHDLTKIRKIQLSPVRGGYFLPQISNVLHLIKPNYEAVVVLGELRLKSLQDIALIFHENLHTIQAESINIINVESNIMAEIYSRATALGIPFGLNEAILSQLYV